MTRKPRPKMSIGPSEPPPPIDADARAAFVGGAKVRTSKEEGGSRKGASSAKTKATPLPWETAATGPRSVQIRTTEKMALQLQYLKDEGHIRSFYSFAIEALDRAIEERLKEEGII